MKTSGEDHYLNLEFVEHLGGGLDSVTSSQPKQAWLFLGVHAPSTQFYIDNDVEK